jgi:hypothetical protein
VATGRAAEEILNTKRIGHPIRGGALSVLSNLSRRRVFKIDYKIIKNKILTSSNKCHHPDHTNPRQYPKSTNYSICTFSFQFISNMEYMQSKNQQGKYASKSRHIFFIIIREVNHFPFQSQQSWSLYITRNSNFQCLLQRLRLDRRTAIIN